MEDPCSDSEVPFDQYEYDVQTVRIRKSEDLKARYQGKIDLSASSIPTQVKSQLQENSRRIDQNRIREKDKADRATQELVLDPRTMNNLYKFIKNELMSEING